MTAVDTNILIYAHWRDSQWYQEFFNFPSARRPRTLVCRPRFYAFHRRARYKPLIVKQ